MSRHWANSSQSQSGITSFVCWFAAKTDPSGSTRYITLYTHIMIYAMLNCDLLFDFSLVMSVCPWVTNAVTDAMEEEGLFSVLVFRLYLSDIN